MQEIWKDIKGYEGWYQVSNFGNVRSVDREGFRNGRSCRFKGQSITPLRHDRGYLEVGLYKDGKEKRVYIHRLVAEAFIDNPLSLPSVNHKNEDKTDNSVYNLEWCSYEYNDNYGTRNERVLETRAEMAKPFLCVENQKVYKFASVASKELCLSHSKVCEVLNGKYNHTKGYHFVYID